MSQTSSAGPYLDESVNQYFMSKRTMDDEKSDRKNKAWIKFRSVGKQQQYFELEFISELFCIY